MTLQLPAGPLSGPTKPRNRRRNPIWRFRRFFFVLGVVAVASLGLLWTFVTGVTLEDDNFENLLEATYICTAEVTLGCDANTAANELVLENGNRVVVGTEDIPQHLVDAVVATEDKSYFEHRGIDVVGVARATYQSARKITGLYEGAVQGGSTITQQYVSLTQETSCRDVKDPKCLAEKAGEFVQAVKYEQDKIEEFDGDKKVAKQETLTRYLNSVYFGRGAYGVQSASLLYFNKNVNDLTLAEATYIVGLLRSPNSADASLDLVEAERRRAVSLRLMLDQEYITEQQAAEANNDLWPNLVPKSTEEFGNLGEVKGSDYGSEYFIRAVRTQLDEIYTNGEYYTESYRVYTTLDLERQKLAYETITGRLDPSVPDMPLGSLVSVDHQGRVVAMMGGADWETSQVNLATGIDGGGSGFQPGSLMKSFALAEFLDQGYSPESYFEAPFTTVFGTGGDAWAVSGGITNDRTKPSHSSVYDSTQWSRNTVFAQIAILVGPQQLVDMAKSMGVATPMDPVQSVVLGTEEVSVLDMAAGYSTFEREGIHLDPVYIERIEDKDGNVVCWYPVGGECKDSDRFGVEALDPSLTRQANLALRQVIQSGTGTNAKLIYEDDTWRASAGKTGTTQDYRDAWFSGFTCGVTTAVWMGYPGEAGVEVRFMSDDANAAREKERNEANAAELGRELTEAELIKLPRVSEIFGEEYDDISGGSIPAEIWSEYMLAATKDDAPCEELATEEASPDLRILGQELLTTLLACETTTTVPPVTNENGEAFPAQPTTSSTAPDADSAQCLPYDESGNVIEVDDLATTTTMPNPGGPVSVDAEGNLFDQAGNRIDSNGRRIDEDGNFVDQNGRRVNEAGALVDEFGNLIDQNGNLIDQNGFLIDSDGNVVTDNNGDPVKGVQADETTTTPETEAEPEMEDASETQQDEDEAETSEDDEARPGRGNNDNDEDDDDDG